MSIAATQTPSVVRVSGAAEPALCSPANFDWMRTPFPTGVEKALFVVPAIPITIPAAVLLLVSKGESDAVDIFFWLVASAVICSSFFTAAWWHAMPRFFAFLCQRRLKDPAEAKDAIATMRRRLFGPWRFGPIAIGLAVAGSFAYFFTKDFSRAAVLAWWFLLLVWGWVIGGAGSVAIAFALAIRQLGCNKALLIIPTHPDGCGGLRFVGDFVARTAVPLLILSSVLAFAALDPHFGSAQLRFLADHFSSPRFAALADGALQNELAAAVAKARVESQKQSCSRRELDGNPGNGASIAACVSRLHELARAAERAEQIAATGALWWRPTIVRAARLGLVEVVISALLCFLVPLWSFHRSMEKAQLERAERLSDAIREAETAVATVGSSDDTAATERNAKKLVDLRKEAREFPSSLWPFDRALLAKVAVPQLVALGGGLAKTVFALSR